MPFARVTDPQTSHDAAETATITPVKRAILDALQQAMTDEQLVGFIRRQYGPLFASESGIRSRRAELVREGFVEDSKGRSVTVAGRQTIIWVRA